MNYRREAELFLGSPLEQASPGADRKAGMRRLLNSDKCSISRLNWSRDMATVSSQYIEGIKEGRKFFDWWKRDGFDVRELLERNIDSVQRLRDKIAPLYGSKYEIEFFDGELDFYRNQLKKLES